MEFSLLRRPATGSIISFTNYYRPCPHYSAGISKRRFYSEKKTHQMLSVNQTAEKLKTLVILDLFLKENLGNHTSTVKASFSKCFLSSTLKQKAGVSKFLQSKSSVFVKG